MTIFKYTMTKYAKSISTWFILLASMIISFLIGGYLPMTIFKSTGPDLEMRYAKMIILMVSLSTSFLAIFTSVFVGFKATTMFKDEVEDGTFLITLSKPQTRSSIIFQKWLALQIFMVIYSFMTMASFVVSAEIFDKGDQIPGLRTIGLGTLKSQIFNIAGIIWGLLIIIGLIFSSISILISTKLSVAATLGITISLGIIIPISGLIATFTTEDSYKTLKNNDYSNYGLSLDSIKGKVGENVDNIVKDFGEKIKSFNKKSPTSDAVSPLFGTLIENGKPYISNFLSTMFNEIEKSQEKIDYPNSIYNSAVDIGGTGFFNYLWPLDINYQVNQIGTIASEKLIPNRFKNTIKSNNAQFGGIITKTNVVHGLADEDGSISYIIDQLHSIIATQVELGMKLKKSFEDLVHHVIWPAIELNNGDSELTNLYLSEKKSIGEEDFLDLLIINPSALNFYNNPIVNAISKNNLISKLLSFVHKCLYSPLSSVLRFKDIQEIPENWEELTPSNPAEWNNVNSSVKVEGMDYEKDYMDIYIKTVINNSDVKEQHFIYDSYDYFKEVGAEKTKDIKLWSLNKDDELESLEKKDTTIEHKNTWFFDNDEETKMYRQLLAIATTRPNSFVIIKKSEYVSGINLLIGYLVVALILLPISYLVLRKQDFR